MVYCQKCGTKNEDNSDFCSKCGANLQTGMYHSQKETREKAEQDCFGLPHGGIIAGIIIGVLIIIFGITMMFGIDFGQYWYVIIIIFGILLVAGAIYRMTHQKRASNM